MPYRVLFPETVAGGAVEAPTFTHHSIRGDGYFGVEFYLTLPSGKTASDYPDSYVTFSDTDGFLQETAQYPIPQTATKGMYRFDVDSHIAKLADKITPTFHYVEDGVEKTVVGDAYSVQDYLSEVEASENTSEKQKEFTRALADLGHFMQIWVAGDQHWTAGVDYTEQTVFYTNSFEDKFETVLAAVDQYALQKNLNADEINKIVHSTSVGKQIDWRVDFQPQSGVTVPCFFVDGVEKSLPTLDNGRYRAEFENTLKTGLATMHTVISAGGSSAVGCTYSYARALLNTTGKIPAKNAMCALYYYNISANTLPYEMLEGSSHQVCPRSCSMLRKLIRVWQILRRASATGNGSTAAGGSND